MPDSSVLEVTSSAQTSHYPAHSSQASIMKESHTGELNVSSGHMSYVAGLATSAGNAQDELALEPESYSECTLSSSPTPKEYYWTDLLPTSRSTTPVDTQLFENPEWKYQQSALGDTSALQLDNRMRDEYNASPIPAHPQTTIVAAGYRPESFSQAHRRLKRECARDTYPSRRIPLSKPTSRVLFPGRRVWYRNGAFDDLAGTKPTFAEKRAMRLQIKADCSSEGAARNVIVKTACRDGNQDRGTDAEYQGESEAPNDEGAGRAGESGGGSGGTADDGNAGDDGAGEDNAGEDNQAGDNAGDENGRNDGASDRDADESSSTEDCDSPRDKDFDVSEDEDANSGNDDDEVKHPDYRRRRGQRQRPPLEEEEEDDEDDVVPPVAFSPDQSTLNWSADGGAGGNGAATVESVKSVESTESDGDDDVGSGEDASGDVSGPGDDFGAGIEAMTEEECQAEIEGIIQARRSHSQDSALRKGSGVDSDDQSHAGFGRRRGDEDDEEEDNDGSEPELPADPLQMSPDTYETWNAAPSDHSSDIPEARDAIRHMHDQHVVKKRRFN